MSITLSLLISTLAPVLFQPERDRKNKRKENSHPHQFDPPDPVRALLLPLVLPLLRTLQSTPSPGEMTQQSASAAELFPKFASKVEVQLFEEREGGERAKRTVSEHPSNPEGKKASNLNSAFLLA